MSDPRQKDFDERNTRIPVVSLTKREYFAAMAMQGIITANHKLGHGELSPMRAHLVISDSIQYADELIKQLADGRP